MPTIVTVDEKTNAKKLVIMDGWDDEVVELCQKWISDAKSLYFHPMDACATADIQFGSLIVKTENGTEFDMRQVLTREFRAVTVSPEKFTSLFNRSYSAVIARWNDNYNCGDVHVPDATLIPQIGESPQKETDQMRLQRQIIKDEIDNENATEELRRSISKVEEWKLTLENIPLLEDIPYGSPEDLIHARKKPHRNQKSVSTPLNNQRKLEAKCLTFSSSESEPQLPPTPSIGPEQEASLHQQTSRPCKMRKMSEIIKDLQAKSNKNPSSDATANQDDQKLPDLMEINSKLTSDSSLNQIKTFQSSDEALCAIPSSELLAIPMEATLNNSRASSYTSKVDLRQDNELILTSAQLAERNDGYVTGNKVNDSSNSQPNPFMSAIMNR